MTSPTNPDPDFDVEWSPGVEALDSDERLERLLARVDHVSPFVARPWLRCAAAALVAADRTVHSVVVARDGRLCAAMPLTLGRETLHGLRVRTLRILGDPLADRTPLLVDPAVPESLDRLLDAIQRAPLRWDAAILSELPSAAEQRATIDAWARRRDVAIEWQLSARVPVLDLGGRAPEAVRAAYSKTLRTRLGRARKRMAQAGTITVERLLPGPGEIADLLATIKAVEDASWKGRDGVGIFATAAHRQFFSALSTELASLRQLEIWLLRLDGTVISYRYGFRFAGCFYDYNLAYLPQFAGLSPGRVLLDEIVVGSARDGLARIDASRASLTAGNLLSDWTDDRIDHHRLWIFNATARGRLLRGMRRIVRPAWRRLRRLAGPPRS